MPIWPQFWLYQPPDQNRVLRIRASPNINGVWTGYVVQPGELCTISREVKGTDAVLYLELTDGRGWIFDRIPDVGILCTRSTGQCQHSLSAHQKPATQCCGVTRAGRRCLISSTSLLVDRTRNILAALPLRRGSQFCTFHAKHLCTRTAKFPVQLPHIFFLDLETTGLDPLTCNIVEIAAVNLRSGSVFSSTVAPTTQSNKHAELVNGIDATELLHSPKFPTAFHRFWQFVEDLCTTLPAKQARDWRSTEGHAAREEVVLVAHNAKRFDVVVLACECMRHHIGLQCFEGWLFADSLDLVTALRSPITADEIAHKLSLSCGKLQCMVSQFTATSACAAVPQIAVAPHRALADALSLRNVVGSLCEQLGVTVEYLLGQLCFELLPEETARELRAQELPWAIRYIYIYICVN